MITFTAFLTRTKKIPHSRGNFNILTKLLFESASIFHPRCKKQILTDKNYLLSDFDDGIAIHRYNIDPNRVVLSKIAALINYLKEKKDSSNVIYLDSDILINGNLEHVFYDDFSIGFTYREEKSMPVNTGIIFIKNEHKEQAITFFKEVYNLLKTKNEAQQILLGEQVVIAELIGCENIPKKEAGKIFVDKQGLRLLLFPCGEYNFSPGAWYGSILKETTNTKVLHFKGRRRHLMYFYWNIYLNPIRNPGIYSFFKSKFNKIYLILHWLFSRIIPFKTRF